MKRRHLTLRPQPQHRKRAAGFLDGQAADLDLRKVGAATLTARLLQVRGQRHAHLGIVQRACQGVGRDFVGDPAHECADLAEQGLDLLQRPGVKEHVQVRIEEDVSVPANVSRIFAETLTFVKCFTGDEKREGRP